MLFLKIVVLCVFGFSFCFGADIELVKPLADMNTPIVLYMPQAGATCEVLIPIQYLYQWPAAKLDEPTITQGSIQKSTDTVPNPRPSREGDFKVGEYKQELVLGGKAIRIQFVVPDKMTTIGLTAHSYIYNNQWLYTRDAFHKFSVEIYPIPPWSEFLQSLTKELP